MINPYHLHKLLVNSDFDNIKLLIKDVDIILSPNNILTNIISFYIKTNDEQLEIIKNNIDILDLHKRDYLNLSNYYYEKNFNFANYIFTKYIVDNQNIQLLEKDINFMINNKLVKLLYLLEGRFIKTSVNNNIIQPSLHNINTNILNNVKSMIEKQINKKELNKFMNFINNINYDYIVDGGNVLFYKGKINNKNINNLYNLCNNINSLVLIHQRNLKKHPNIKKELEEQNIKYYLTPYNHNDDLFILLAFLNSYNSFIISNDKYRDHIFCYNNTNVNYNQFKNILYLHTLGFTFNKIKPCYSYSIQIVDTKILCLV
jgi:hypothetical protein